MLTQEELDENVQYVLGMTDHYKSDEELHNMLLLKGLEEEDTRRIIRTVAYAFNKKRMLQRKRAIKLNSILFIFTHVIPGLIFLLATMRINIGYLSLYLMFCLGLRLYYILLVAVPCWLGFNIYAYFKYKKRTAVAGEIGTIGTV
ncbi:hypothetical protein [Chitinophaga sp. Cy-1792]|uniref:hypothetical protein n=1 Tax=Chitinophaga sp. Cy-1792 TaxID=2608339 RepID=UPI00142059E6|nr:hypothetical protein [Chitinophaga sp. Cy-1792]NIG53918.1 hypothetical protein [Chitinophaga sp. Cy-1792]